MLYGTVKLELVKNYKLSFVATFEYNHSWETSKGLLFGQPCIADT